MTEAPWPPVVEPGDGLPVSMADDLEQRNATARAGIAYLQQHPRTTPADDPQEGEPRIGNRVRAAILSRAQLGTLPRPEPLITDTLDKRTIAVLAGRRSTGKSFLALDWACCIATGRPWQGRPVDDPGPVLYIAAEGAHGLDQRVQAWEYAWHAKADQLRVLPVPVNLYKAGTLVDELLTVIHEDQPRLVVIDTWARSTVGGKENDNTDSTIAFEQVDRIRRLGATALVLAHTDKGDTTTRGASALEDNADTVYRIKDDDGTLELDRTKRKDGPTEDRHQLRLRTIALPTDDEWERSSCVLEIDRGHDQPLTGRASDLLSVFVEHFADTGCSKAELRNVAELAPATFSRGLNLLVKTGALVNKGTDERPFYKAGVIHATP